MDSHVWKWEWAGSIGCSRLRIFFLLAAENIRNYQLIIDLLAGENVRNYQLMIDFLTGENVKDYQLIIDFLPGENIRNYQLIFDFLTGENVRNHQVITNLLAGENVRNCQLISAWLFINAELTLWHFLFLVWHCDWWQFKRSTFTNTYIFPRHPIDGNSVCDIVPRWYIVDNILYWWQNDILLTTSSIDDMMT